MTGLRDFRIVVAFAILGVLMAGLVPVRATASEGAGTRLGDLTILAPWARASAGAGKTGAAYLTVVNHGTVADRLVAVRTDRAARAALHTHEMAEGVMKMRPIEAVSIAPGGRAELKPGGDHVMLMGLHAPLEEGEAFALELVFEKAGRATVTVRVGGVAARTAPMDPGHEMPQSAPAPGG